MNWRQAFLLPLLLPPMTWAADDGQSLREKLDLQGGLHAGYFSRSFKLDGERNLFSGSAWLKMAPHYGDGNSLVVEGWIRNDESFQSNAYQGYLREAYLNLGTSDTDVRIGKQIIAWGRADKLNPTDNLTPHNYTWLTPNDDDQRTGAWTARVTRHLPDCSATAVWLARLAPNVIPIAPISGVSFREQVPKQASQGAIKFDCAGGDVDWSMSYFNGLDMNPDIEPGSIQPSGVELILEHHRIKVLGVDAATVVGRYGLRAEATYTWTASSGAPDDVVKRPFFYAVVGGDRTFSDNLNVNIQYYLRHVVHFRDPSSIADPLLRAVALKNAAYASQDIATDHGVTIRIDKKWMQETLESELLGQFSMVRSNYALKARLIYAFDDQWKGTVGLNLYRGSPNTLFNELQDISAVFAELKYGF